MILCISCSFNKTPVPAVVDVHHWDYYLIVAVDAKQLDYSSVDAFITSLRHHERDVGHAWITLKGQKNGHPVTMIGGHTGEFGLDAPRFLDQFHYLVKQGDKDPVRALFQVRHDGQFEVGSGGHIPTFAVAIRLNQESYNSVLDLLGETGYDFTSYNILNHHCVHFAATCLALAGHPVDVTNIYPIPQKSNVLGEHVQLWTREEYNQMEVSTPEALELALRKLVDAGVAVTLTDSSKTLTSTKEVTYTSSSSK